jgi:hypothetical protein
LQQPKLSAEDTQLPYEIISKVNIKKKYLEIVEGDV